MHATMQFFFSFFFLFHACFLVICNITIKKPIQIPCKINIICNSVPILSQRDTVCQWELTNSRVTCIKLVFLVYPRRLGAERKRERWLCSSWPPQHGVAWMALFVSSVLFPKPLPPKSRWKSQIHENIIHKNAIVWIKLFQRKRHVFVFFCKMAFLLFSQM